MEMYTEICSFENLFLAYRKARKGKRGKAEVADFELNQEEEIFRLQEELVSAIWQPGPFRSFYIHDPKRRLISAAPFRDRVVHHALCNVTEPVWERSFIFDSYANRVGKGTHRAIVRCQQFSRRYRYALQCDVAQFFPSIDHDILAGVLQSKISDAQTMQLIQRIIASGTGIHSGDYDMRWFPGDDLLSAARPRGLPIGNLTSQFWANVYLNAFDHFVKRELRCPAYLRYVDDFLLFADDKNVLSGWRDVICQRLARLRLALHPPQIFPVETGIPFLGFRIYPDHRRLKRKRGVAFQRKLGKLYGEWRKGEIPISKIHASIQSWVAHCQWGDTWGLRRSILGKYVFSRVS